MSDHQLPILYQDDHYIAINKPAGLLVHPTLIDKHEKETAVGLLQEQTGKKPLIIHRLDKPTSGILILAWHKDAARNGMEAFARSDVKKVYLAIVRGFTEDSGTIKTKLPPVADKLLDSKQPTGKKSKSAVTGYRTLGKYEFPVFISRHPQSRYSLVEVHPITGRMHQIRRHLKHIRHPIIGDTKYGDHKHNKYFRENLACRRLLLSAVELTFFHPYTREHLKITAALDTTFLSMIERFGWKDSLPTSWLS